MANTNKQPATPLPWKSTKRSMQLGVSNVWVTATGGQRVFKGAEGSYTRNTYIPVSPTVVADMDFAVHAANNYADMVAAMREVVKAAQPIPVPMGPNFSEPFPVKYKPEVEAVRQLLAKLGE